MWSYLGQVVLGSTMGFSWFMLYLEWSPKLGNVWIRCNDLNELVFAPQSLMSLIKAPLQNSYFWHAKNFDINAYVWILLGNIGAILINCL